MSTQGIMKKTPSKDDLFRGWELGGHEPYDEGIGDDDDYGDDEDEILILMVMMGRY